MPSTSDERAARWPGMDTQALGHLHRHGFILRPDSHWEHTNREHHCSARDIDALAYLIEEWDFGWLNMDLPWELPGYGTAEFDQAFKEAPVWVEPEMPRFVIEPIIDPHKVDFSF